MYEHTNKQFPEHAATIRALVTTDNSLRALLADFEEISTWMATQDNTADTDDRELDHARTLIQELQVEIRNHLEMACNQKG